MDPPILKLLIKKGPREGETFEYQPKPKSVVRIGRVLRGNTLAIKDDGVSSKHLSIHLDSGKWVVTDLESSNGTNLNSSQLQPHTDYDLRDGDAIKIGEITLIEVQFLSNVSASQLRRSTRSRGATKTALLGSDESTVAVTALAAPEGGRSRRGVRNSRKENVAIGAGIDGHGSKLGAGGSEKPKGEDNAPEEGKQRRRDGGRPSKARNEEGLSAPVESEMVSEVSESFDAVGPRPRRGGVKRKANTGLKEDVGEAFGVAQGSEDAGAVQPVVPPRRGRPRRAAKNKTAGEQVSSNSELEKILEISAVDSENFVEVEAENVVPVQDRKTRGGRGRRKKNEEAAAVVTEGNPALEEKDKAEEPDLVVEACQNEFNGFVSESILASTELHHSGEEELHNDVGLENRRDHENGNVDFASKGLGCDGKGTLGGVSLDESILSATELHSGDEKLHNDVGLENGRDHESTNVGVATNGLGCNGDGTLGGVSLDESILSATDELHSGEEEWRNDVGLENGRDHMNTDVDFATKGLRSNGDCTTGGVSLDESQSEGDRSEKGNDTGDAPPDLDKITLGEWFDYMERYLPKYIHDVTEQVITDMQKRSQQVQEYMLQQQNMQKKGENLQIG